MARARAATPEIQSNGEPEADDRGEGAAPSFADEKIVQSGPKAGALLDADIGKHLPDPRADVPRQRGDATAKNRREQEHDLASARVLGGEKFAELERRVARARAALLEAPEGADLAGLQKAYRETKHEHDEAAARYAEQAREKAKVRRYRVVDNNNGKARLANTAGSHGRARFHPGKEVDSLNYDIDALRKQGVRLEEIDDENEAAA